MKNNFYFFYILLIGVCFSCSDDTETSSSIPNQEFQITENAPDGTVVGEVSLGDFISFVMEEGTGFDIDSTTGELLITDTFLIDFETAQSVSFTVNVNNGELLQDVLITINIIDEADGPLTNLKKELFDYLPYLALNQDPSSQSRSYSRKMSEPIKIFVFGFSGVVTPEFMAALQGYVNDFNSVIINPDFYLEIVDTSPESNVQLFRGSLEQLQGVYSDMYMSAIEQGAIGLFAPNDSNSSSLNGGRIWVSTFANNSTIQHEIGHALGFGHSNLCDDDRDIRSYMCGPSGDNFSPLDRGAVQYFYHPDMPGTLNNQELRAQLEQIFLNE